MSHDMTSDLDDYQADPVDIKLLRNIIADLVGSFLYYDRKEDESCPRGAIQAAIRAGDITPEDIVELFQASLEDGLGL